MRANREQIVSGKIPPLLIKLTIPTIAGMLGMMIFNIVDTYFVGQLGSVELAAISFTFPVVMFVGCITLGLGTAVMALFSRAAGTNNIEEERRLATTSLILGVLVAIIITIIGWLTTKPLFRLLGADEELIPYIVTYMNIWYLGSIFVVIPMIGDHILRGLGDTITPSLVMLSSAVANLILDPILIFGMGPIPAMGMAGAAIATVFSRMICMCVSLAIQIFREHLISFRGMNLKVLIHEGKDLIYLGIPNSMVKAIIPLGTAVFTSILSRYGHEVVAGYGVATKIEGLFFAIINSLAVSASIFIGQNLGAKENKRIQSGTRWLYLFGLIFGLGSALILAFCGKYLGALFNDDPLVQITTKYYLLIIPISYAFYSISQTGVSILNVYHKPIHAGALSLIQIMIVAVPLSYLFSRFWQERGVFAAISISYIIVGILSIYVVKKNRKKLAN